MPQQARMAVRSYIYLPDTVECDLTDLVFETHRAILLLLEDALGELEAKKASGPSNVRLAGALSLTLDDLRARVEWTPGEFEFEIGTATRSSSRKARSIE